MRNGQGTGAVVFDLGGVLIDWDPRYLYRRIFDSEEEMEHFLGKICTPEWNRELDRGRTFRDSVALLCSENPGWEREISAYHERWDEMLGEPYRETVGILERLHAAGTPLHALTNWSAETIHFARERYEFLGLFDEIIVSGEEGVIKPDPAIYGLLVERTGINPERSVFVDDREENVRAAERLGFDGAVFRDAARLRERLAGLGLPA